jgi:hypothetical protein
MVKATEKLTAKGLAMDLVLVPETRQEQETAAAVSRKQ